MNIDKGLSTCGREAVSFYKQRRNQAEHLSLLPFFPRVHVAIILLWLLFLVACSSKPKSATQPALRPLPNIPLVVAEVPTAEVLDATGAKLVLEKASSILKQNSCGLVLSLKGDGLPLNVSQSTIYTSDDYDEVCTRPGYIHIVDGINWCDGTSKPNILGCSSNPGTCMVVVRYNPPSSQDPQQLEEAILWLHEYGHTKNLKHRNDPDAVMNLNIEPAHLNISPSECSLYTGLPNTTSSQPSQVAPATVEEFVRRVYIHGVPFEQAKRYRSPADMKALAALLGDNSQEQYWPNVVATLGAIGTPEASKQLVSFVSKGEGRLSPAAFRAKTSALVAMGYVLGQSRRQSVLSYLVKATEPKSWATVRWSTPSSSDTTNRDLTLARGAVAALGLSGDPKAQSVLRTLEVGETTDVQFKSQIQRSAKSALNENIVVRQTGFDAYVMEKERFKPDPLTQTDIPKPNPQ